MSRTDTQIIEKIKNEFAKGYLEEKKIELCFKRCSYFRYNNCTFGFMPIQSNGQDCPYLCEKE